jgi:hypothetical protein
VALYRRSIRSAARIAAAGLRNVIDEVGEEFNSANDPPRVSSNIPPACSIAQLATPKECGWLRTSPPNRASGRGANLKLTRGERIERNHLSGYRARQIRVKPLRILGVLLGVSVAARNGPARMAHVAV